MSSSSRLSTVLLGVFSNPNPNQHSTPIVPTHQHQHTNERNISLVQEKKKKQKAFSRREAIGLGFSLALLDALAQANSTAIAAEEAQCTLTIAPSGLAFCDRVVGTGAEATKGQLIKAHYVGMLENGKVFDSSYSRGKPLTFRVGVGEVIKGWDQGILGGEGVPPMLAGGKRTLKLPPQLGYGLRGAGCKGGSCIIPPDSVLLFDVEFIGKA
ncbi:peptidyl-prolyl cis-trans isomerase FKBP13, chloroplastic-like protein isoform X1 [Cinnamomum micranthum f. kanehirae]|uniref:peptidylprolyl isomerase n=1 Tax=Cinnamomum micranthum f. kanehirae TaxID=337451 RepID=A0A3S3PLI4_9MAGN|nr:peptidyl-prolyl cis-trans isomerase FKBP13, chloroplastic-like protein isoform X1 [Cinnamomum micranthum f. kanehirae]